MRVDDVNPKQHSNFNFKMNVVHNKVFNNTMNYLKKNSTPPSGFYNYSSEYNLMKKVVKALKKHPSKETLEIERTFRYGEMFGERGVISSSKATLIDTEPARDDSVAPVLNIVRRILDPENEKSFHKLAGEQHKNIYQKWWDKNIAPIWPDINDTFRENTFFEGNHDKSFNIDFNSQSGKKSVVTSCLKDGYFVTFNPNPPVEYTTQKLKDENLYHYNAPKKNKNIFSRIKDKVMNYIYS